MEAWVGSVRGLVIGSDVEGANETQRSCQRGDNPSEQPAEIGELWALDIQNGYAPPARISTLPSSQSLSRAERASRASAGGMRRLRVGAPVSKLRNLAVGHVGLGHFRHLLLWYRRAARDFAVFFSVSCKASSAGDVMLLHGGVHAAGTNARNDEGQTKCTDHASRVDGSHPKVHHRPYNRQHGNGRRVAGRPQAWTASDIHE